MSAYCDYNATSLARPEAIDAIARALALGGNPSSVHARGRRARALVEDAREALAARLRARPADLVFTSGATEGLQLAVEAAQKADPTLAFIRSSIEHPALAELPCAAEFSVGADGMADLEDLEAVLAKTPGRPLVALMRANNETGVLQPVAEAAEIVRRHGGLLICDAVQAFGKVDVHAAELGADYLVVTAHKLGGPAGIGALVLGCDAPFIAPRRGGGQERGRRSGTENFAGIAGFAAAADAACATLDAEATRIAALRDGFEAALKAHVPEAVVIGANSPRLPNTSLFALPGGLSETLVIAFDLAGVCVSAGAACSSGKTRKSRVLDAMNVPDSIGNGAIRASFGHGSAQADADALLAAVARVAAKELA